MANPSRTVNFNTQSAYQVFFTTDFLPVLEELVSENLRVGIVFSAPVAQIATEVASHISRNHQVTFLEVPAGEAAKNVNVLANCWEKLAAAGFTRSDLLINIGGGATTDLGGFLAATWLRGVSYINIPTTVLAMTDAALGGKTGMNIDAGKNLVGAFHEPKAVFCNPEFLATLPQREIISGLGEILKCGFIKDTEILQLVLSDPKQATERNSELFLELIVRGAGVKADFVSKDFKEKTSIGLQVGREGLNYGHTLAHAIEAVEHFNWRHGEADAVGMTFAAELAHQLGHIDTGVVELHREVFTAVGLPTEYRGQSWESLKQKMMLDKKTRANSLRFILLSGAPGNLQVVADIPETDLLAAFSRISS